jgi:hypothetical protein
MGFDVLPSQAGTESKIGVDAAPGEHPPENHAAA